MDKMRKLPVRLALREEGEWWNAYLAQVGTMENAKLIASTMIGPIQSNPVLKRQFLDFVTAVMKFAIEQSIGSTPVFAEEDVPESERSGHA
jgi:hypothetical protein